MKVAPKLVFLFRDPEGFSAAIFNALQPIPDSALQRLDEKFELSLEQCGINDQKGCGDIATFVDNKGLLQVSLLLVQNYEPPVLACVINELLRSIKGESSSSTRILILPYILPAARLKCEDKNSSVNNKSFSIFGMHMGPETEFTRDIVRTAEKPPSSLQIHYEPFACMLQFVNVFKFPTALLIGKRGIREEHEVLHEMGELLASAFALCFEKNGINLNLGEKAKVEEPWRALYG